LICKYINSVGQESALIYGSILDDLLLPDPEEMDNTPSLLLDENQLHWIEPIKKYD
jgi:hypothetical protein